jgi:hypothetical protein
MLLSAWMIASLRSDFAAPDTSVVHGCIPSKRSPPAAAGCALELDWGLELDCGLELDWAGVSFLLPHPTQTSAVTDNSNTTFLRLGYLIAGG